MNSSSMDGAVGSHATPSSNVNCGNNGKQTKLPTQSDAADCGIGVTPSPFATRLNAECIQSGSCARLGEKPALVHADMIASCKLGALECGNIMKGSSRKSLSLTLAR